MRRPVSTIPGATAKEPVSVRYTSFDGDRLRLMAYTGRRVAVLVPSSTGGGLFGRKALDWDAPTVGSIVDRLDATYEHYRRLTGRTPRPGRNHEGRTTFAVVPTTCGAGCAYLGSQGIETLLPYWQTLHEGVAARDEYDQLPFYEMGRNFWFLDDKLGYLAPDAGDPVVTGFAVVNRFTSMEATGTRGGPWLGRPFAELQAGVRGLVAAFEDAPELSWANTLRVGSGVPGSGLGATDLFASFILRLADLFGHAVHEGIWREAAALPNRRSTEDAVDNLVLAACAASSRNLTALFSEVWRFPVSPVAAAGALSRWGPVWRSPGG